MNNRFTEEDFNARRIIRHAAVALCLTSTLVLAACGGGSGGEGSRYGDSYQDSENSDPGSNNDSAPGSNDDSDPQPNSPDQNDDDQVAGPSDDSGSDDDSSNDDYTPEEPVTEEPVEANGSVLLEWSKPEERENGEPLYDYELGGYEVRYREEGSDHYTSEVLEGWSTDEYTVDNLQGSYEFEIAAYDKNGLYSEFVNIDPAN